MFVKTRVDPVFPNQRRTRSAQARERESRPYRRLRCGDGQHRYRRHQGDAPHTPRGCVAQAWSVAETLRAAARERRQGVAVTAGLVEAGRIRLVAEGPSDSFVPGTRVTRIDEPYPMSEVVRTLSPRFIETPEEFAELAAVELAEALPRNASGKLLRRELR